MDAKLLLSSQAHPLTLYSNFTKPTSGFLRQQLPWLCVRPTNYTKKTRPNNQRLLFGRPVVSSSLVEPLLSSSLSSVDSSLFLLAADAAGYSVASYYTSLGLFVISVPGLWSLIKRSVKSKVPMFAVLCFVFTFSVMGLGLILILACLY